MKIVGNLLVLVSLVVGVLGAATAYLAPLDWPDDELVGLTLTSPAGLREVGGKRLPLVAPGKDGKKLDANDLAELRKGGVEYLRVQEFSWLRWPGKWLFLAGVVGLSAGAALLGAAARQLPLQTTGRPEEGPESALAGACADLAALRQELLQLRNDEVALTTALTRLSHLQQTRLDAFVEARPQLVARLGLAGFAQLMDQFAAGERQVNRAWSAAADGLLPEVLECLDRAGEALTRAQQQLK